MLKSLVLISTLFAVSLPARASQVEVQGVPYIETCSSFEQVDADFALSYLNPDLPTGAQVVLHWGLGGSTSPWQGGGDIPLRATAYGRWDTKLTAVLRNNSRSATFDHFRFVFLIIEPNRQYWDRGTPSAFGYYDVKIPTSEGACVDDGSSHPVPPLRPLAVQAVPQG